MLVYVQVFVFWHPHTLLGWGFLYMTWSTPNTPIYIFFIVDKKKYLSIHPLELVITKSLRLTILIYKY